MSFFNDDSSRDSKPQTKIQNIEKLNSPDCIPQKTEQPQGIAEQSTMHRRILVQDLLHILRLLLLHLHIQLRPHSRHHRRIDHRDYSLPRQHWIGIVRRPRSMTCLLV